VTRAVRLPGAGYVALGLAVPAGFATDPAGAPGTAHLCEHLAIRVGAGAVPDAPVIAGRTNCHATLFTGEALPGDLERAVSAFAAMLSDPPEFPPGAIEQERDAIGIELDFAAGMRLSAVGAAVCATLAPSTGLGAEHAANRQNLHRIEAHHIGEFWARHYRADRATLVAAGDLDPARLDELADHAGLCRNREPPPHRHDEPPPTGPVPEADVWGVAFLLTGAEVSDAAGWTPAVEATLTGIVKTASCGPPTGTATLRCHTDWITLGAWRGQPSQPGLTELATHLRNAATKPLTINRIRHHDLAHRGKLCVPTAARDALLAQATGTGPTWPRLSDELDPFAATQLTQTLLTHPTWWHLHNGHVDILNT